MVTLACSCLMAAHADAQVPLVLQGSASDADVLVSATIDNERSTDPIFQALWRGVGQDGANFQWQPTTSVPGDARLMLDRLLEPALAAYLDTRIHFAKLGVHADLPAERMMRDLESMVRVAAQQFGASDVFMGFSEPTRMQLDRLTRIDWSQARFGVDGGNDQDKYLAIYYYVRSQRDELDRQIRADLLDLASVAVLGGSADKPGTALRINSTCGTVFDEQNFLCALDLQLADADGGGVDPRLSERLMASMTDRAEKAQAAAMRDPDVKIRKRDRWLKEEFEAINTRIDRMDQRKELWVMRDRLDDIEDRISGLELEVKDTRNEMRRTPDNPLSNLSDLTGRNIAIRFARNSIELDAGSRLLLNEVFEQLARSPQERVLITGYTDRSGDPSTNLRLSEARAKSVRNYLLQRGIAADRLMVNYYGDSRSMARNPDERRVEVEWLR